MLHLPMVYFRANLRTWTFVVDVRLFLETMDAPNFRNSIPFMDATYIVIALNLKHPMSIPESLFLFVHLLQHHVIIIHEFFKHAMSFMVISKCFSNTVHLSRCRFKYRSSLKVSFQIPFISWYLKGVCFHTWVSVKLLYQSR